MLLKKLKHKLKINSLRIKNHFYLEVVFLCLYLSFESKRRFWSNDKFINLHNRVSHKINIPRIWSRIKINISPMRKLNSIFLNLSSTVIRVFDFKFCSKLSPSSAG